jgi:hypothetical protein
MGSISVTVDAARSRSSMTRLTRLVWGVGLAVALGLAVGAPAGAQDDGDGALDAVRALVPVDDPGLYDLAAADTLFGQLATAYGASAGVDTFDDASALTGPCGGFAYSYDDDGDLVDAAADFGDDNPPVDLLDGGQAFTGGNRFKVDTRGVVVYFGFMPHEGDGPRDFEWDIKTAGIPLDSGDAPNPTGERMTSGRFDLADEVPVGFSADAKLTGELTTANIGICDGDGQVEFLGNGLADPVAIAAMALFVVGLLGVLFNARPAMTWKDV